MPKTRALDPIDLEIQWNRLISIVDEAAFAIMRTSMSKVVMEGHDFGALLYDDKERMLATDVSIASKSASTPLVVSEMAKRFPAKTLKPGDVLATNNPWWCLGHLNDVSLMSPIFYRKRLVGYAQCMAHMADIGGSLSGSPREVYEEGLIIPPLKIVDAGTESEIFFKMFEANVRVPGAVVGDVRALIAGLRVIEQKTCEFLERHDMVDLGRVGNAVIERSQERWRKGILASIPDGVYHGETNVDGFDRPLTIKAKVTVKRGIIDIDFDGTSPQSEVGINATLAYTTSWSKYIIKCLVAPELPHNDGGNESVRVTAPPGCLLNPTFPAPVKMKPATGHFIPLAVLHALEDVVADNVLAEPGNKFLVYMSGRDRHNEPLSDMMFVMGGMGARLGKDGLHATDFPAHSSNLPVEVFESTVPVRVKQKRLRQDSGGAGRYRGGCGQTLEFESLSDVPLTIRAEHGRLRTPPLGLRGGGSGAPGGIYLNENEVPDKSSVRLARGDVLRLHTPGSGGTYPAQERDREAVRRDIADHVVSPEAAARDYAWNDERLLLDD